MTAREDVLARIRTALGDRQSPPGQADPAPGQADPAPGRYRTSSGLSAGDLLSLLTDRLSDYGAAVRSCTPAGLAATVEAALAERGARRAVVPPGLDLPGIDLSGPDLPGAGLPGIEYTTDDGLTARELDTFDAVITTAALAIAETGTIVLDGTPGQGRRALSLIPDYHLCILRDSQVVGLVTEALPLLGARRPLTWISGPSATSDIELSRVQGVHGPRTLEVILVAAGG